MYRVNKILLVEDEIILSISTGMILTRNGYNIEKACTGEDAVNFFKSNNSIDLILMDIDLGDGISGTQAAISIMKLKVIPIIFLTSHSEKEMVEKVKDITRYGYVLKNSGEFVLLEAIKMAEELFNTHKSLIEKNKKLTEINYALQESDEIIIKSKNNYKMLFNNMKLGFALHEMLYDANGKATDYTFLDINPSFEEQTGLKKRDVIGKTVLELLPETEHYWIETYDKVLKTGKKIELKNFSKELNKYYSVTAFKVEKNIFAVLIEDISEHLIKENMLHAANQNLNIVINSVDEAVITFDDKLNITNINSTAEEITGLSDQYNSGQKITTLIDFPNREQSIEEELSGLSERSSTLNFIIPV